jgi:hypothetical protein
MEPDLNEIQPFRSFRDERKGIVRYNQQMPILIAGETDEAGNVVDVPREPFEVVDVFERMIVKPALMEYWFDTGTGLLVPAKGSYEGRRFKIRHKSESLRGVNPKTELVSGGIPHESYEEVRGAEFIVGKDGVIVDRNRTEDEALNDPSLLEILGGDESFRGAVVDRIFFEGSKRFNDPNVEMMGTYLQSEVRQTYESAFYVNRLDSRSRLGGWYPLDDGNGRLVGYLASETPGALDRFHSRMGIEKRIITAAEFLKQAGQTSAYAPEQIAKLQATLDQRGYAISRKE